MTMTTQPDGLTHEPFCMARPGLPGPRTERYTAYVDDPATGRSRPAARVHRCIECGATTYDRMGG